MRKIYEIIDCKQAHVGDRTSIATFLEKGEATAIVGECGFGLSAYVRGRWDGQRVKAIYDKHGVIMPSGYYDACKLVVDAPDPDEVMRKFLDDFVKEIVRDSTVVFRIKDRAVYGVRILDNATAQCEHLN